MIELDKVITHTDGMEAEWEIALIDRCLESTKFRLFNKEQHFNEENKKCVRQKEVQRYITDLLKSRRDALISQQVIR